MCAFASAFLDMHNLKRNNLTENSAFLAIDFLLIAVPISQSLQEERRLKFKSQSFSGMVLSALGRNVCLWLKNFCDRKERWRFLFVWSKLRHFMTS